MALNMFPHTITLYNKYKDGTVEKWQRTTLIGVYWNAVKGSVSRKTGTSSADSLQLIIPMMVLGYKSPKEWAKLENKQGYWTLESGDMVVLGNITQEVTKTSAELKQSLDNCLTISSVDTRNIGAGMAHWEVGAK